VFVLLASVAIDATLILVQATFMETVQTPELTASWEHTTIR
jgi:hypothetical protein